MDSPLEEFYRYISSIGEETIKGIANEGANYQDLGLVVRDLIQRIARAHNTLSDDAKYQEELANSLFSELCGLNPKIFTSSQVRSFLYLSKGFITKEGIVFFKNKLSMMSKVYEQNPDIFSQLEKFRNHRSKLTNCLLSRGNELQRNYLISKIGRMFGNIMGIICSLNLNTYLGGILTEIPSKISSFLDHSVLRHLVSAGYFSLICIILLNSSAAEYFRSKYVIEHTINVVEEDRKLFEPIEKFLIEKKAMQSIFEELFLLKMDEKIVKSIEESLTGINIYEKIFASILVASLKKYPSCLQDVRFLHILYQFSRTEEAEEWYRRMLIHIDPDDQAKDVKVWEEGLFQLKVITCVSSLRLQSLVFLFKPPILPGIVLAGLHSFCLFYEIKELKCVKKCMLSKELINLASQSEKIFKRALS